MKPLLKNGSIGAITGLVLAGAFTLKDILKKGPTEQICAFNECPSICPCKIGFPGLDPIIFQAILMFLVFISSGLVLGLIIGWIFGKIKSKPSV